MTEPIVTVCILSLVPLVAEICKTITMNQFEMDALIIGESINPLLATVGMQVVAIDHGRNLILEDYQSDQTYTIGSNKGALE